MPFPVSNSWGRGALVLAALGVACAPRDEARPPGSEARESRPAAVLDEPVAAAPGPAWDRALARVQADHGVTPAPPAPPNVWLRRASLVLAGRVPTPRELRAFVARTDRAAREEAVTRLLADPGFPRTWGRIYASWFVRSTHLRRPGFRTVVEPYYREATARSYAEVARELIAARGAVVEVPAATFLASQRPGRTYEEVAAITLDLFVGKDAYYCAQCHDHPDDPSVRQEDLWHVAAYFARTRVPRRMVQGRPNVLEVRDRARGELRRPEVPREKARVIEPRYLDGRSWLAGGDASRREALAEAIVADPAFAEAFVARAFAEVFGAKPHPALAPFVRALAEQTRRDGYDLRLLLRALVLSDAFARDVAGGADGDLPAVALLARFPIRPLPADVRLDALLQVTSAEAKVPHFLPLAERAMRVEGARRRYRHVFDDPAAETLAGTIPLRLSELHDPVAFRATRARPGSRLDVLERAYPDPRRRLAALFAWVFARSPTPDETTAFLDRLAAADDPRAAWEDLFHAAVLSAEFSTLH